jgi:hypothetical protein
LLLHKEIARGYIYFLFFIFLQPRTTVGIELQIPILLQFFASDERIKAVRQMIMAATTAQRQVALDKLLPYQRSDFEGIFRVMDGEYSFDPPGL